MDSTYPLTLEGTNVVLPIISVSFESGEQVTALKLPKMPFRYSLVDVRTAVHKALANTDAGTVTLKNGSTTLATVTIPLSSAIATETAAPSIASMPFELADQLSVTAAKATAGGKAYLYLTVKVLPQV
jgi:hypothetical protein